MSRSANSRSARRVEEKRRMYLYCCPISSYDEKFVKIFLFLLQKPLQNNKKNEERLDSTCDRELTTGIGSQLDCVLIFLLFAQENEFVTVQTVLFCFMCLKL